MFTSNLRKCFVSLLLDNNKNVPKIMGLNSQIINNYSKQKQSGKDGKGSRKLLLKRKQIIEENFDKNFLKREVVDPVWLMNEYKPQVIQIEQAFKNHIEMAQSDILNNSGGYVTVRLFLDMSTKKKAKFMDDFKGAVYYPNSFKDGIQKEVVAICKTEEEIEVAKSAGALHAGHIEVLKMFEKGEIVDQMYDFLVCTPETYPDVMLIKKKIHKEKLPNLRSNTVSTDIGEIVRRFYLSKDYETEKLNDSKGTLKVKIGTLDMGYEKLTENLSSLIEKIREHKKYATDDFINECVVIAAPSTEKFKVDLTRFNGKKMEIDDGKVQMAQSN